MTPTRSRPCLSRLCNRRGFTLQEVLVVITVLGIASVVVAGRMFDTDASLASQTEVLKAHMRYAQAQAMNYGSAWGVHFTGTDRYSLFKNGDTSQTVQFPGENTTLVMLRDGVQVDWGMEGPIVSFNADGVPYKDAAASATAQTDDRAITVSSTSGSRNITVVKDTGFIQ